MTVREEGFYELVITVYEEGAAPVERKAVAMLGGTLPDEIAELDFCDFSALIDALNGEGAWP